LVTTGIPAKTAEPIEVPFGLWTRVDRKSHGCLVGVRIHQETGTIWRVTLGRVQTCYGRLFQLYSLGAAAVRSLATRQTTGYL